MPGKKIASDPLSSWRLLPTKPDWAGGLRATWQPGEKGARERLAAFLDGAIGDYAVMRDRPDRAGTSRLSPHLHFGEITPSQCWHAALAHAEAHGRTVGHETFLRELAWREFSYHLLFHSPDLPDAPFRKEFVAFPWVADTNHLTAWQRGKTGYPIVDAGMRELWTTGWMHNRVRMIAASFLIKDLMIPWQAGEAWFWDTLVDADLASNAASWQWVAGSGADAAPFFRIFNPVTQGEKFDPDGDYVRRWVPELARLPAPDIHAPGEASRAVLSAAGVTLGKTYPLPIVDHAAARARALAGYDLVKATARTDP
jgi:deoxyribodipyrimidine photo-lyase